MKKNHINHGDSLLIWYAEGGRFLSYPELDRALAKARTEEGRREMLYESMLAKDSSTRPRYPNRPRIHPRPFVPTFDPPTHLLGLTLG